jgi:hypothetical protein
VAKRVGDIADALTQRVTKAGFRRLRFWGAPDGFAMVLPLEPIDEAARPLQRLRERGVQVAISAGGPLDSIMDGFKRMFAEPIRNSRILLVVVTTDSKVKHPAVQMTPQIGENWAQSEYVRPSINRNVELTEKHFAVVFVYEFRKEDRGQPRLVDFGHRFHSVTTHLAGSGISFDGLLE